MFQLQLRKISDPLNPVEVDLTGVFGVRVVTENGDHFDIDAGNFAENVTGIRISCDYQMDIKPVAANTVMIHKERSYA